MDEATACFRDLARLTATGNRLAVLGATNRVAEGCLRLCAVPAASSAAAENKTRKQTDTRRPTSVGSSTGRRPRQARTTLSLRRTHQNAQVGAVEVIRGRISPTGKNKQGKLP